MYAFSEIIPLFSYLNISGEQLNRKHRRFVCIKLSNATFLLLVLICYLSANLCSFDCPLTPQFLLILQEGSTSPNVMFTTPSDGHMSSVRFADNIIGSLGASLREDEIEEVGEDGTEEEAAGSG